LIRLKQKKFWKESVTFLHQKLENLENDSYFGDKGFIHTLHTCTHTHTHINRAYIYTYKHTSCIYIYIYIYTNMYVRTYVHSLYDLRKNSLLGLSSIQDAKPSELQE
jgi:hypothetical protein